MKVKDLGSGKGGYWIAEAIKKPGALRQQMGVKKGETIPVGELREAAAKKTKAGHITKLARRARLALTLRSFRKGGKKAEAGK